MKSRVQQPGDGAVASSERAYAASFADMLVFNTVVSSLQR
jgi:hypothetical protein